MRKPCCVIATTVDGFVAGPDGTMDFLPGAGRPTEQGDFAPAELRLIEGRGFSNGTKVFTNRRADVA